MPINTHEDYIEIGTSVNADNTLNNVLVLPAPVELPASNEFMVSGSDTNAVGTLMFQQVGRTQYKTQVKFGKLKNKKWWEINRWFDTFGYVFYMKYFSHTEGMVKIQKFYRGNMVSATPSTTLETMNGYSVPTHYYNGGFSVIDIGEENVIIVSEMAVN